VTEKTKVFPKKGFFSRIQFICIVSCGEFGEEEKALTLVEIA